ncbi:MAG: hypothetical protein KKA62_05555 [Nanoarchaeota archaeon]|nr:hypothetical protein [Nanoarchaeota archaeon]MBU1643952.1 hypothetical protein [Nanoarchaeota archaeon]MBU1977389.1 hypothetical protein [Nanoarchaeota archaeon]
MAIEKFKTEVLEKEQLTKEVFKLVITVPENLFFKPGQFMTFTLEKDSEKKPRSYSIFSSYNDDGKMEFIIKLIAGGFASQIFEEMKKGDHFDIRGPFGHFVFDDENENEEQWFIGSGTGLAPLHSMLKEKVGQFPEKKFVLLLSMKHKEELLFHEELLEMEEKHPNFVYMPTLTREEWEGKSGRVQKYLPEDVKRKTFYICGIKELVLSVKEHLLEKGVKPEDIKFERYS